MNYKNLPFVVIFAGLFLSPVFTHNLKAQIINTFAGNGSPAYSGDGGPATAAGTWNPQDVAVDKAGNIYIADVKDNAVRIVNAAGIIHTFAGVGTAGFSGDGGPANSAQLNHPTGLAIDTVGNIYIADQNNNRIRKVSKAGTISTIAGNGVATYFGDGGQATAASLNNPIGVGVDVSGNIYIGDNNNHRVRKVNTSGIISTFAGNGTAGYSGDGGLATAAEFQYPWDIKVDHAGNVFITDFLTQAVRKVNSLGIVSTIAGNGTQGFSGDGGQATAAEISSAGYIAFDNCGNLFISDNGNSRIRKVDPKGIISTYAGNGTQGFAGDEQSTKNAEFFYNNGIIADEHGNLYVADLGNNRVRIISTMADVHVCFVSVDTASKYNQIYWDKTSLDTNLITGFNIYEKGLNGDSLIGYVSVHSPSTFVDSGSKPNMVSSYYGIAGKDTCGNVGPVSPLNETILLQANKGVGNAINLNWNPYNGDTVYYYEIERDTLGNGNWDSIGYTLPTVYNFTDNNGGKYPNGRYVINTIWKLSCKASLFPMEDPLHRSYVPNNNNTSFSNRKNTSVIIGGIDEATVPGVNMTIYPNPVKERLNILFHEPVKGELTVTNVVGEVLIRKEISSMGSNSLIEIPTVQMAQGVYLLNVHANSRIYVTRFIKI